MQHLHNCLAADMSPHHSVAIQARVRFLAYHRIKPDVPPLVRAPVNSFEFHRCRRTPQVEYLTLSLGRLPVSYTHLRGKKVGEQNVLESTAIEHDSCVCEAKRSLVVS